MRWIACLGVAAAVYAQPQPVPQDPEKARFEGVVLNSVTNEPLRKCRLTLRMNVAAVTSQRAAQPPQSTYTITSDSSGKFEFVNVDPGDFQLAVTHDGFAEQHLGNTGNGRRAEPILLARGDRKTQLTIKLVPYGAIAGALLDEDGDPIRNLRISAMAWRYTNDGRQLREVASAQSNDLGEYRIFDVPAGRYLLKINPRAVSLGGGQDNASYGAVFYPGTPQPNGAIAQDITPGQQLRGLVFNLRKARVATISGTVIAPPDATRLNVGLLIATEGGSSSTSSNTEKGGKFKLMGVPPGFVYVTGDYIFNGQRHDVMVGVEVGSVNIEGLELRPLPPADVTGRISVEGDPAFDVSKLALGLEGASSGHNSQAATQLRKDGTLLIPGVTPGKYRIRLGRTQELYIKSIRWGTAEIVEAQLDLLAGVPPRTELAIMLGADGAELTGTVTNDKSEPVEGATVTVVPLGAQRSRGNLRTLTTDAVGHFSVRGFAPGSYRVFAWDQVNVNAVYYDPDFLRPYETAGTNLDAQSKGKHTLDLKLIVNKEADDRTR